MTHDDTGAKLVRDKIPQLIHEHDGVAVQTRILSDDADYEHYLYKKLIEEAHEVVEADDTTHITEEVADLYEVIDTILKLKGITHQQVLEAQALKREHRGGFTKRVLMFVKR